MNIDSIWNYNNPAETEKKFREIIAKGNHEKDFVLELKTQIGRTLSLRQMFDEAHTILEEVESQLDTASEKVKVRYLLERGRTFNSSGKKEESLQFFSDAYELAKASGIDNLAIDALHMIAIVVPPDEALDWNMKAIELAHGSQDDKAKKWLGSLYNNSAWSLHDLGKFDEALELFMKNVEWHTENNSGIELCIAKWCVGRTLRSLEKTKEALKLQMNLADEIKHKGFEEDGYVYEEIGECLLSLDRTEEAKLYFAKAYELLSQDTWLVKNESERLNRLKEFSK